MGSDMLFVFYNFLRGVLKQKMDSTTITYILIIAVCVVLSAYFSATETAFSSLNKTRLKTLVEKGSKKAKIALNLSEQYDKLISTILIGNNIVNIAMASIGPIMFIRLMGDIGATVSTAVITVVVLIFGEISPKSIAKDMPEKFAMFSAPLIKAIMWLFTPLNFLFSWWKKLLNKMFAVSESDKMSQEELLMLVNEVEQDGSIDEDEGSLLKNVIEFSDLTAEDILTHRTEIEAVSEDDTKQEISKVFASTKFSRLLVYSQSIDNIIGVIHQKDFYSEGGITKKSLKSIMTPPVFIQKFEKISNLLKLLQAKKSHVAVVIDEYGGTHGIVTMEDILEELVGEIWDEHDEIIEEFKPISENCYKVDCAASLDDFCEFFDLDYESESVSVSGFIMEMLGKIPEVDDNFIFDNIAVKVTETEGRRPVFAEVRVTKSKDTV